MNHLLLICGFASRLSPAFPEFQNRAGMTHDRAMDQLIENAGTQFDPEVVNAMLAACSAHLQPGADSGRASPAPHLFEPEKFHPAIMVNEQELTAMSTLPYLIDDLKVRV